MPWNARPEATRLAPGIPKAQLWAYDPGGINQVGCVYTAQGFEFDYVGVIWGSDLRFDPSSQQWVADRMVSSDNVVRKSKGNFEAYVRNIYRVLLSRGLKGCYVYCVDDETAKFLLSRCEGLGFSQAPDEPPTVKAETQRREVVRPVAVPVAARRYFQNCIPVYDLRIAAGQFGDFQIPDPEAVEWIAPPEGIQPSMDVFAARVEGDSMNRIIPNGAWCVFRFNPAGTRNGRIVLAQLRDYSDPDSGAAFTVKRYESIKVLGSDGDAVNAHIRLKPESTLGSYKAIDVSSGDEGIRVIAEFLRVL